MTTGGRSHLKLIITQDNEQRPNPSFQLGVDAPHNRLELGWGEVGRQLGDGLNVVEGLNPSVRSRWRWSDLDQGPGYIADHLDSRALIRVTITLSNQLQDIDPDPGLAGDAILDRQVLDVGRPLVTLATEEVGAKLAPDRLAIIDTGQLNSIGDFSTRDSTGRVVHDDDLVLATHEQLECLLHIGDSSILPRLSDQLRGDALESGDDEVVFEALVRAGVVDLRIGSNLGLQNAAQTTMVLLQTSDPILKNPSGFTASQGHLRLRQRQTRDGILGRIKQVRDELEAGISSQMYPVVLILGSGIAWQKKQVVWSLG